MCGCGVEYTKYSRSKRSGVINSVTCTICKACYAVELGWWSRWKVMEMVPAARVPVPVPNSPLLAPSMAKMSP